MSDGCVVMGKNRGDFVSISSKDIDWLEKIRDILAPESPIKPIGKNGQYGRLRVFSRRVCNWFVTKGCTQRKSLTLSLPQVPEPMFKDFVRGIFDGDGSISVGRYNKTKNGKVYQYNKVSCYICSGSKQFITDLDKEVKKRFNICGSVMQVASGGNALVPKKGMMYRLSFGDRTACEFLKRIYYDHGDMLMPRKYKKALEAFNRFGYDI